MSATQASFNFFSFKGKYRVMHLTWFAFFLTFVVWFSHAPLMASIRETFDLTTQQVKIILILNVALTIPARIIIGMLVDHYGPRKVYSSLLLLSSFACIFFATAESFETLAIARFMLGFVGAGFVIGIRMISEWFPVKQVGLAEGIYGGWGNFGSAAAALTLPSLALFYGGDDGWRYAIGTTGIMIFIYAFVYFNTVTDTPEGSTYFKPNKTGGLEVTSKGDFFFYLLMNIPLYAALAVLTWKLTTLALLTSSAATFIYIGLIAVYAFQTYKIYQVNAHIFKESVPEIHKYKFKQVAILDLSYMVTFGSELAVVSMLPLFFLDTFEISQATAGMLASGYAFMNLVARPTGGWFSDKFGRKKTLIIAMCGLAVGYFLMSQINSNWMIPLAVIVTMSCSFFVQSGEGAVFAVVPLVQRRLTGQIAGMAGAYGNVGAVCFLTIFSFVSAQTFFLVIAVASIFTLLAVMFLDEPKGTMTEVLPDGTVQMIEVA
ncbi:MAG: NarK family nitrate/nitrite MFS transporter [Proteobacteria bacterium]|nr:NarK family nitrate/nitrite MFS transporter [Pseudomonadota bacterium]NOG59967.1 NarK family nitrate/nitrite MFS transporter [Pseudomonadota bacterium]